MACQSRKLGVSPGRRVLYIASSPNLLGGAEHCLVDIVAAIGSTGWEPHVVVPGEGSLAEALRQRDVPVFVEDLGVLRHRGEARSPKLALRLATSMRAARRIRRVIRDHDILVVHSNAAGVVAGAIAARRAGIPHVWHVRELLHGRVWDVLRRAMYRYSSTIVCISRCVADHVEGGAIGSTPVVVIADGIDISKFSPSYGPASNGTVVMLSRIHPDKGHEEFIRSAALLAPRFPQAEFLMAGGCLPVYEPLQQTYLALIEQLGLTGRAKFLPNLSRSEAAALIKRSDVVVVPSTWVEPGGLVVLEAMASGKPVVAPDRGGPAEVIQDGVNGFVVPVHDPARIAAAVERLLSDPELCAEVGMRARERVQHDFDVRTQVQTLHELYTKLVGNEAATCV